MSCRRAISHPREKSGPAASIILIDLRERGIGRKIFAERKKRRHLDVWRAKIRRFAGFVIGIWLVAQFSACALRGVDGLGVGEAPSHATFRKFLALAEAGDAESQNAVGFMLFYGEGVNEDRGSARTWFRLAAAQGNALARRNLEILDRLGGGGSPPAREHAPGQSLYEKFCAGCHGFNGISAYVYSPSFALGETLHKSDDELMRSLLRGKGEMPNWDDKFSRAELSEVLRFVRTLRSNYELGIGQPLRSAPPLYYRFGPMAN